MHLDVLGTEVAELATCGLITTGVEPLTCISQQLTKC
jgi:hypothetical protein